MAFFEVVGIGPEVPREVAISAFKFTADVLVGLLTMFDGLVIVFA